MFQAFINVINSPLSKDLETRAAGGAMVTISTASEKTIELTVRVLRRLIPSKYRDQLFQDAMEKAGKDWELMWEGIVDSLLRNGWFEEQGLVARIN